MNTTEQQQDSTVAAALVIKRGWNEGGSCSPRPVIVMAGESGVVFSRSDNMGLGVKFTAEEWKEVVTFVEGQFDPYTWEPNWAEIPKEYIYLARDQDSQTPYVFSSMPKKLSEIWDSQSGLVERLDAVVVPNDVPWTKLFVRPGL